MTRAAESEHINCLNANQQATHNNPLKQKIEADHASMIEVITAWI